MTRWGIIDSPRFGYIHVTPKVRLLLAGKGGRFRGQPTGSATDMATALIGGRK